MQTETVPIYGRTVLLVTLSNVSEKIHIYWQGAVDFRRKQYYLADYPAKLHPTKHHIAGCPTYVINNILKLPTHANGQFKLQR